VGSSFIWLHIKALFCFSPQCLVKWGAIKLIVLTQYRLDCIGCFHCMVMWHCREEMVSHMSISYMVKHLVQNPIIPVHSCQSTLQPLPFWWIIVRQRRVCVLQICDGHEKAIYNEPWHPVNTYQPNQPSHSCNEVEKVCDRKQSSIRNIDQKPFAVWIYGSIRVVVACKTIIGSTKYKGHPSVSVMRRETALPSGLLKHLWYHATVDLDFGTNTSSRSRTCVGVVAAMT